MEQIIECVPNFSEGRDMTIIKQITNAIERVPGVKLLNVDPGYATNRTVVTFAGNPEAVTEGAFQAIKKAAELIDMRNHNGEHPRFGATDVCPLVPISGISMEETVEYARKLAKRVGDELGIHVYCYEFAAFEEKRQSLANCRSGEYEGLEAKIKIPEWKPDFGPETFNAKSGASAIGARNFLIAYNINLNTTSVRRANAIAFDVRESGRVVREGDPLTGKIVRDENGEAVRVPGSLKRVRAIGWYIKEYGIAQISMNLTDITVTPIHVAFDEVCERARERGLRVTGSELIGLIPLKAILEAGKYFLRKQNRSTGIPDHEIIDIAVKSLGLSELAPFDPKKRIIEYLLEEPQPDRLADQTLTGFAEATAADSATPGGGSVSAVVGAFGAALGTMVANLSAHKRGWDDRWEEFSGQAEKGKYFYDELLKMADEDTNAYNMVMEAYGLPKETLQQKEARKAAIQAATIKAIKIPFRVMELAYQSMEVIGQMAETGNPNSVSDAAVGALCAYTAVAGAHLNVKINASGISDRSLIENYVVAANEIELKARRERDRIVELVNQKLG